MSGNPYRSFRNDLTAYSGMGLPIERNFQEIMNNQKVSKEGFHVITLKELNSANYIHTTPTNERHPITVKSLISVLNKVDPDKCVYMLAEDETIMALMDIQETDSKVLFCMF